VTKSFNHKTELDLGQSDAIRPFDPPTKDQLIGKSLTAKFSKSNTNIALHDESSKKNQSKEEETAFPASKAIRGQSPATQLASHEQGRLQPIVVAGGTSEVLVSAGSESDEIGVQ